MASGDKTDVAEKKLRDSVSGEVEKFAREKLHKTETQEHNALPSTDAIAEEKQYLNQRKSIEDFDAAKLKHVNTRNTESTVITQERILSDVGKFTKDNLKHTQTSEPDPVQLYAQEKTLKAVGGFSMDKLKHTETQEKNPLPTKEVIAQEKMA